MKTNFSRLLSGFKNPILKPNFSQLFKSFQGTVAKHAPEILTGVGIAGLFTTTILAVKATPKAIQLIEETKNDLEVDKLKPVEIVKAAWKQYIPAAITGISSAACLAGANSMHMKRNAALFAAYKIAEVNLADFKDKAIETIGEKKVKEIKDKICEEKVKNSPPGKDNVIITGNGRTLCYDIMFGTYFESDIETINKAVNAANRRMLLDDYVSVNDLYEELCLPSIHLGDMFGWSISDGYIEVYFSAQLTEDDRPCIVLNYENKPSYDPNEMR